jgi:hypothetical protein
LERGIYVRTGGDERKVRKTPMAGSSNDGGGYPPNKKVEKQEALKDNKNAETASTGKRPDMKKRGKKSCLI